MKDYRTLKILVIIIILILVPVVIHFQVIAAPAIGYNIYGLVASSENNIGYPISNATVKITNTRTGEYLTTTTDEVGIYLVDISELPNKYQIGDVINVTVTFNALSGYNIGEVINKQTGTIINVTIADMYAPDIFHESVSSAVADENLLISADIKDGIKVSDTIVWYLSPGKSSYEMSVMVLVSGNRSSGTWEAMIPETGTIGSMYYYISANDTAGNNNCSDFFEVNITHGKADHFNIYAPSETTAGAGFDVTVVIADSYNNIVSNYSGTVELWTTDQHSISIMTFGSYQLSSYDGGIHIFQGIKVCTAPSQIIGVYDSSNHSIYGNMTIMVMPNVSSVLQIIPEEVTMVAGNPSVFSLRLLDEYGNTAPTDQLRSVILSTTSPNGSFSPSRTFDFGIEEYEKVFMYIDTDVSGGPHFLNASTSSMATANAVVNIVSSDADRWAISPRYTDFPAGELKSFTLQLLDSFGNPVNPAGDVLINLTTTSRTGEFRVGNYAVEGIVLKANTSAIEFNYTDWNTANTPSMIMVNNGTYSAYGFAMVNITPGPPNRVVLAPSAIEITAGENITVNVKILDIYGNICIGANTTLYVNTTDPLASGKVFELENTNLAGIDFKMSLLTVGTHALVVECYGGTVKDEVIIKVKYGNIMGLKLLKPDSVNAGVPFSGIVYALDEFDNIAADYNGTVSFTSDDMYPAKLPTPYGFSSFEDGHHIFGNDFILYTTPGRNITVMTIDENISTTEEITVLDNVIPAAKFNRKEYENNLESYAKLTIQVSDNIRIEKVKLYYSSDNMTFSHVNMIQTTGNYSTGIGNYSAEIYELPAGDLYVYFSVSDGSNVVEVFDNSDVPFIFEVNNRSNYLMIYMVVFVILSVIIISILLLAVQNVKP